MDSTLGRLFCAAPARTPSVTSAVAEAAEMEVLAPCWEALASPDGAQRVAAMMVLTQFQRPELWARIAADARGWNDPTVRRLYRAGLLAWTGDPELRSTALSGIAGDLEMASGLERLVLYQVFRAVFEPDRDPGPCSTSMDWSVVEPFLGGEEEVQADLQDAPPALSPVPPSDELEPEESYRRAEAILTGRRLVVALAELLPVLSAAVDGQAPDPEARDRFFRGALGVGALELAQGFRVIGELLLATSDGLADGRLPVLSPEQQWKIALLQATIDGHFGDTSRPELLRLSEAANTLAGEVLPTAGALGLDAEVLLMHPLFSLLGQTIARRVQRSGARNAALEAQLSFAFTLAHGGAGLPPLEGARELMIAKLVGLPPPWTERPRGPRLARARRSFARRATKAMADTDLDGLREGTVRAVDQCLSEWAAPDERWTRQDRRRVGVALVLGGLGTLLCLQLLGLSPLSREPELPYAYFSGGTKFGCRVLESGLGPKRR
jgi:hypothetical protein